MRLEMYGSSECGSRRGKHLRKSLRTRDFDAAMKRAEEMCFQTFSDVASGRKIFGVTIQEMVDVYLDWRGKDVAAESLPKVGWAMKRPNQSVIGI